MSLGGKARLTEQDASLTPDETSPPAGAQEGAGIRAHVRQILLQVGSGSSIQGN